MPILTRREEVYMKNFPFKNIVPSCKVRQDDRRLILASVPVLLFFILFFGIQVQTFFASEHGLFSKLKQKEEEEETRVYPVLVKDIAKAKKKRRQISALSDSDSGGSGGLTRQKGFHSLSPHDSLSFPRKKAKNNEKNEQKEKPSSLQEDLSIIAKASRPPSKKKKSPLSGRGDRFRIPSNYNFRQDFLLRFDGSSLLALPRRKLAGFAYFRKMIQTIRENFAPPGMNYMYRDQAGYVINQSITAQVVQVAFALDPMGNVSDVRKIHSINQKLVDEACLNSLRGKNFGKPPREIFEKGNVFGINFVFPKLRRR